MFFKEPIYKHKTRMLLHPYSLGTIETLERTLHVGAHVTNSTGIR
ncbi:hypothetical protein T01_9407 [Trichinella spiralis]|uniref:Uncharacterized protein n=1 Tax=Trichinella spiralis TaxID=6334 RepID=A0A0V0YVM6_TRISP|nr:hypothetical protein T01_9407 [Trichinella spiralis]